MTALRATFLVSVALGALAACEKEEPARIVLNLRMLDGRPVVLAYPYPGRPDMGLAECRKKMRSALPALMEIVFATGTLDSASMERAECVLASQVPPEAETGVEG